MTACLLRPSLGSMSITIEIAFDCSFCVGLLLLGSQGGASFSKASPDSIDRWNQYARLGPFFCLFFQLQLLTKQQSNIHCIHEKYSSTIQKGPMWFFPSFGIRPGRKVTWSKVLQVLQTRGSMLFKKNSYLLLLCLSS